MISTTDLLRWIGSAVAVSSIPLCMAVVSSLVVPDRNLRAQSQQTPQVDTPKDAGTSPPAAKAPATAPPATGTPAAPAPGATTAPATGQPMAPGAATAQPPVPAGPANAAVSRALEGKGEPAKKKSEKPARNIPREEYIEKPGALRKEIENFRESKRLPAEEPGRAVKDRFDDMRKGRGGASVDRSIIDQMAKWHVYSMTGKSESANITRYTTDITTLIRQTKGTSRDVNTEFLRLYKQAIIKYAKDLLNNSYVVRINAILLINDLFDGTADVNDGVPVYLSVLKDPKQEDPVKYVALLGLERAKAAGQVMVEQERTAAETILDFLSQNQGKGVQPILMETIARTLGKLGRVSRRPPGTSRGRHVPCQFSS